MLGRTVIHTAVWKDKKHVIKRIAHTRYDILNVPDNYGILPITYAGLLGNSHLVLLLMSLRSNLTSGIKLTNNVKKKFIPMFINLKKLKEKIMNLDYLNKIDLLIRQIKEDFRISGLEHK